MLLVKSKYKIAKRLGAGIFEQTQTQKFALSEARSRNRKSDLHMAFRKSSCTIMRKKPSTRRIHQRLFTKRSKCVRIMSFIGPGLQKHAARHVRWSRTVTLRSMTDVLLSRRMQFIREM